MLRRWKDYIDELSDLETTIDEKMSRADFAILFNIEKYQFGQIRYMLGQRNTPNPFAEIQIKHGIQTNSDDNSFFQIEDINKRSARRAQTLWVFESLIRTYRASAAQPYPEIPPPQYLPEIKEYVNSGLTPDCIITDAAERGCHICFTLEAQNYNPIMYCKLCESGVHARCFGEDFIEDIDKQWYCHVCREKKLFYKYEKEYRPLDDEKKALEEKNKHLTMKKTAEHKKLKKLRKPKLKRIKNAKCFLCRSKGGFLKSQKKTHKDQATSYYHPFCVMVNPNYSWRNLVQMREVVYSKELYPNIDGLELCMYCKRDNLALPENMRKKEKKISDQKRFELLIQCHDCRQNKQTRGIQKFHPMCAWLNGN